MINVEINRTGTENNATVLRKFTRRVQEAGILNRVRSRRYAERPPSPYVRKKRALKSINRKREIDSLIKLGKIRVHEKIGANK